MEMILTDVEHCRPQVELVEELGDEDVHLQHVGHVFPLHVPEDVNEPLEISVGRTDPEEVNFLAGHAGVSVGGGAEHQIVQDRSVGSDSNTSAHHHGHLELVPILVS